MKKSKQGQEGLHKTKQSSKRAKRRVKESLEDSDGKTMYT